MTGEDLKQTVRKRYGKIAAESGSCCGPNCGCETSDKQVISLSMNDVYQSAHGAIIEAADLGLGCGTPTAFADLAEGMTVLDLGSGAGIDVFLAAKELGPTGKAIGIDMTDEMLERANANRQKLGILNAEFRKGEIENMPIESDSVDRIVSNCVINLVPDKRQAFAEMYRVLKRGGKFTVSDIVSIGPIPTEVREDMLLWAGCISGAVEKTEYLEIIKAAGFTNVLILTEKPYELDENIPFAIQSITVTGTK